MAIRELLRTMLRGWYVMVAALLCAVLLAVLFARGQVVYTTRTSIDFTYPDSSSLDPFNGAGDKSLISFVSAIAQKVNNGVAPKNYADLSAPYYGAGIRQGVNVSLPNEGNQFITIYRKAQIDIDIVGPSYEWVQARQTEKIVEVANTAEDMQSSLDIAPTERMVPAVEQLTLPIFPVAPSRSALILAASGLGIAALLVGGWGAVMLERLRGRSDPRSRSRPESRPPLPSRPNRVTEESKV